MQDRACIHLDDGRSGAKCDFRNAQGVVPPRVQKATRSQREAVQRSTAQSEARSVNFEGVQRTVGRGADAGGDIQSIRDSRSVQVVAIVVGGKRNDTIGTVGGKITSDKNAGSDACCRRDQRWGCREDQLVRAAQVWGPGEVQR